MFRLKVASRPFLDRETSHNIVFGASRELGKLLLASRRKDELFG
jgi:hypothetical protein